MAAHQKGSVPNPHRPKCPPHPHHWNPEIRGNSVFQRSLDSPVLLPFCPRGSSSSWHPSHAGWQSTQTHSGVPVSKASVQGFRKLHFSGPTCPVLSSPPRAAHFGTLQHLEWSTPHCTLIHNTAGWGSPGPCGTAGRAVGRHATQQLTCSSCVEGKTLKNFEKHGCDHLHGAIVKYLYVNFISQAWNALIEIIDLLLQRLLTFRRLLFCLPLF